MGYDIKERQEARSRIEMLTGKDNAELVLRGFDNPGQRLKSLAASTR